MAPLIPGSLATAIQEDARLANPPQRLRRMLGVAPEDLLTTADIHRDYRVPSTDAVRAFLARHPQIPIRKWGRKVLVERRDIERFLMRRSA